MPTRFDCPSCKTSYDVADDLAGKMIMCRACQKRGPVRAATPAAAGGKPTGPVVAAAKSAGDGTSRRNFILLGLAALGSVATGALLARRPWRHWGEPEPQPEDTNRAPGRPPWGGGGGRPPRDRGEKGPPA